MVAIKPVNFFTGFFISRDRSFRQEKEPAILAELERNIAL